MEIQEILDQAKQKIIDFRTKYPNGVVIIRWATATGKSRLSVMLSQFFDTEIISADSRQIFRYMDIGTDKVSQEIRDRIPHHQIDIVNPDERYTAGQWQKDTYRIIEEIQSRGKLPMIVGGTGLYIDTIYKNFTLPDAAPNPTLRDELYAKEEANPGYLHATLSQVDPEEAQKLHPNSTRYLVRALEIFYTTGETKTDSFIQQPVKYPLLMLGLRREKDAGNMMINARIKEMFAQGLVAEVQDLLDRGYTEDLQSMQGIGYKEVIPLIRGEYTQEKSEELLKKNTHHLAKKQRTRFRRYIAEGIQSPKDHVEYIVFHL